jgi:hypothetical protein
MVHFSTLNDSVTLALDKICKRWYYITWEASISSAFPTAASLTRFSLGFLSAIYGPLEGLILGGAKKPAPLAEPIIVMVLIAAFTSV